LTELFLGGAFLLYIKIRFAIVFYAFVVFTSKAFSFAEYQMCCNPCPAQEMLLQYCFIPIAPFDQHFSTTSAIPIPPPIQRAAKPVFT
jgi:hypothetical protein